MKLAEKDKKDASLVHLPWDAGMAALAGGAYEVQRPEGDRGPDMPMAQSPFPGTEPKDGTLQTADSKKTPNMTGVMTPGRSSPGLPKEQGQPASQPSKSAGK